MKNRPHLVPCLIGAAMALVAIADLPYGYYTLMRLVVCATAAFVIVVAARNGASWAVWAYSIIALLFNPIMPIHLTKGLWQPLDFLVAIALVAAGFTIRSRSSNSGPGPAST